jgi:hypothetical protein
MAEVTVNNEIVGKVISICPDIDLAVIEFYGKADTQNCKGFVSPSGLAEWPDGWPEDIVFLMKSCNGDATVRIDLPFVKIIGDQNPDRYMVVARFTADRPIQHHDSGSGVFLRNKLVGMVSNALDIGKSNYGYMIRSPEIKKYLENLL